MKVLGLIVEYNPFHNGHLYHLEESKKASGADYVICVMSGNFIQRGEPALVNKWARAKMALLSGVDLVIELPSVFAMASAEYFAYGAVKILDSIGVVDYICFGSESGSIEALDKIAETLVNEPDEFKTILKEQLDKGLSYPAARENALREFMNHTAVKSDFESLVGSSNNILGIEYLKALKKLQSGIVPLTIHRINNSYNTEKITGSISSATSIRRLLSESSQILADKNLEASLSGTTLNILKEEFEAGRGPVFMEAFENIILSSVRKMTSDQIKTLPYVAEGLENRIKEAAENSGNLEDLVENIVSKRYTRTRIQRILSSILTGVTAEDLESFMNYGGPQYARVLGFNKNGRKLLSEINKSSALPVIIKTADFKKSCNPLLKRMLEIEATATDAYVLAYKKPDYKKAGQEFTQNLIIL